VDIYAAPECQVVLEVRAEQPLRLRPACPLGFTSTAADSRLPYDALLIVGLRR
jgi:hypothetical protein